MSAQPIRFIIMKYKLYAFDFDLTLADTIEVSYDIYGITFASVGVKFDKKDVFHHLTRDLTVTFSEIDDGTHDYNKFLQFFIETEVAYFDKVRLYPDVLPTIKRLKENGAKIALITNRNLETVARAMEKYGKISDFFDYTVTGDITTHFKPHPEPVLHCLEMAGVDKKDMVYIGDAVNDCKSATAAGVDFIYVNRHGQIEEPNAIKTFDELL